jgi:hypothetical protein
MNNLVLGKKWPTNKGTRAGARACVRARAHLHVHTYTQLHMTYWKPYIVKFMLKEYTVTL